jgi:hypothetical protein
MCESLSSVVRPIDGLGWRSRSRSRTKNLERSVLITCHHPCPHTTTILLAEVSPACLDANALLRVARLLHLSAHRSAARHLLAPPTHKNNNLWPPSQACTHHNKTQNLSSTISTGCSPACWTPSFATTASTSLILAKQIWNGCASCASSPNRPWIRPTHLLPLLDPRSLVRPPRLTCHVTHATHLTRPLGRGLTPRLRPHPLAPAVPPHAPPKPTWPRHPTPPVGRLPRGLIILPGRTNAPASLLGPFRHPKTGARQSSATYGLASQLSSMPYGGRAEETLP